MEFIFAIFVIVLGIFVLGIVVSGLKAFCGLSDRPKNNRKIKESTPNASHPSFDRFLELIEFNADMIQQNENKDRRESTYLSICTIYDDLMTRQKGKQGIKDLMSIVLNNYPELLNEIATYAVWKYESRLAFDENFLKQMEKRHS